MDIFGIILMSIILSVLVVGLWWSLYEMGKLEKDDNSSEE
jgi:hypothetical protein